MNKKVHLNVKNLNKNHPFLKKKKENMAKALKTNAFILKKFLE